MKEGGTGLHKTIREINLVYKGLTGLGVAHPIMELLTIQHHMQGQFV